MAHASIFTAVVSLALLSAAISGCAQQPQPGKTVNQSPESAKFSDCTALRELLFQDEQQGATAYLGTSRFTGTACSYHKNGNVHTLTTYHNGLREGAWEVYYPNGNPHKAGIVRNVFEDGLYHEYHPGGQLQYEYHYDLGAKVGVWKSWYADGTPYTERHFEANQLHGKVLVWDEAGQLAKEYEYRKGVLVNSYMHFKE